MNIKRMLVMYIIVFTMILGFAPTLNAQATTKDFNIISNTEVTAEQAKQWAKSKGATETFAELSKLYWKYADDSGVNPGIAYVQAAKETGYGKFGGVLDESYKNPCGMKTASGGGDYDKNAHQKFNSWDEGVQAHLDHLALYAGADGYPKSNTYDPRHFVTIKGKATTTNSLGGRWAPSAVYGEEVGKLYMNLLDYSGVSYDKNDSEDDLWDDEDTSSNPNPGTVENKPKDLDIGTVIEFKNVETDSSEEKDSTPDITSTIGWKQDDGKWYYYKSDESKVFGWIKIDGKWYYLDDDDGSMATGWLHKNNIWHYLEESGAMVTGWKSINNKWYFFNKNGEMLTGIQRDGNNMYYLNDSGEMINQQGWQKVQDKWIYVENSGKLKLGWFKDDNESWYYLQGDGSMVTGIKNIDGKVYSFYDNGIMQTGWKQVHESWYYFLDSGEMATGWTYVGDDCYYLYDNGAMAKGWINIGDSWYLLNSSGAMQTGWVTSGDDMYYLDKSTGRMLTNTVVDGYKLGNDGKRRNKVNSSDS
ncbi:MAG: glucosaminidase domain-containing protein, partial [Clostridium sp.]